MIDLREKKTALVIIDVQNDYFKGGVNPLVEPELALEKVKRLLDVFRQENQMVVHVRHINNREGRVSFLPNTYGSLIHEAIEPLESEHVIIKHFPDSFYETDLHAVLRDQGIERLVVCGMMTQHCIDTSVRAAYNHYDLILIHDACATKDLVFGETVISAGQVQLTFMAALQRFAEIMSCEAFVNNALKIRLKI